MLTDDGFHAWCLQNRIPVQNKAGFEEWKPVTALETLAVTMPERYQREPIRRLALSPGGTAPAAGWFYRVRTNAQVHPFVIQNLKFLLQTICWPSSTWITVLVSPAESWDLHPT